MSVGLRPGGSVGPDGISTASARTVAVKSVLSLQVVMPAGLGLDIERETG